MRVVTAATMLPGRRPLLDASSRPPSASPPTRPADARVPRAAPPHPERAQRARGRRAVRADDRRSSSLAVWLDNWFVWIAAFVLMGRAHAQFAALMHEAAHRLLFRNRKRQRLGRPLAARLPVVHADRPLPPRPHGAPPRRVRPRRARHPALPRLPDLHALAAPQARPRRDRPHRLEALQGPPARRRAPTTPAVRFQARAHRRRRSSCSSRSASRSATRGSTSSSGSRRISPSGASSTGCARSPSTAACSARRTGASRRTRCSSRRSSRFFLVPFHIGWHLAHHVDSGVPMANLPKLHAELRRAGYVTDELEYRELPRALAQARRAVQASAGEYDVRDDRARPSTRLLDAPSPRSCARRRRCAGCAPTRSTTTPSSRCSSSPSTRTAGRRRAVRVRRRPRPRRPPPARPRLPPGLVDLPARPPHPRRDDALLEARQWEADHFEDVPVIVVACVRGRRPCSPRSAPPPSTARRFPAVQNLLLAAAAPRASAASATTLAAVVGVGGAPDARAPRAGHAGRGRRRSGRPRGRPARRPARRRPRRQRRAPRPVRPPAISRPAGTEPRARARTRHNGRHDSRQVTTCPEKDEHAGSVKRAKLKQGYDDGLFREGSGTLADLSDNADADDDSTTTTSTTTSKTKRKTGTPTTS